VQILSCIVALQLFVEQLPHFVEVVIIPEELSCIGTATRLHLLELSELATDTSGGGKPSLLSILPDLTAEFLKEITDGFSAERKLGEGTFGTVYKVWLGLKRSPRFLR